MNWNDKPNPENYTTRGPYDQLDFDGASYYEALQAWNDSAIHAEDWEPGTPTTDEGEERTEQCYYERIIYTKDLQNISKPTKTIYGNQRN